MNEMKRQLPKPWYRERSGLVFLGFAAAAGILLAMEHWVHILPWLPWTLLLACPLMHIFMHRGHGGHGTGHSSAGDSQSGSEGQTRQLDSDTDSGQRS